MQDEVYDMAFFSFLHSKSDITVHTLIVMHQCKIENYYDQMMIDWNMKMSLIPV